MEPLGTPTGGHRPTGLVPAILLAAALSSLVCTTALAEKTDVVELANGDHITCEIQELQQGQLQVKTDYMRTVTIDWRQVTRVTSGQYFEVELETGRKFYGTLGDSGEDGVLEVNLLDRQELLDFQSVVSIIPIEQNFIKRIKGTSLSLGIEAYKAQSERKLTLGLGFRYRDRKWFVNGNADYYNSSRKNSSRTTRTDINLTGVRYFGRRWGYVSFGKLQQNEEQSLKLRTVLGAGAARAPVQTTHLFILMGAGLAYTNEQYGQSTGERNNLELFLNTNLTRLIFRQPESSIVTSLMVFPSLTNLGRVRVEFNAAIRHELFSNFYIEFSAFDNYDSDPPTEDAIKNDWGLVTSFGYTFR